MEPKYLRVAALTAICIVAVIGIHVLPIGTQAQPKTPSSPPEDVSEDVRQVVNPAGCGCVNADAFTTGTGTKQRPYEIENAAQLRHIEQHCDQCFRLVNDIDLSAEWVPLCADTPFTGDLAGNRRVIHNLSLSTGRLAGLFATIGRQGCVHDLSIDGKLTVQRGTEMAGSVVGQLEGTIEDVTSSVDIQIAATADAKVGGIAGHSTGMVRDSVFSGDIASDGLSHFVGAIIGYTDVAVPSGLPSMITAHAGFAAAGGASDKSEDNTIDNLIKSICLQPDAIEVDVTLITTDTGQPLLVLEHDELFASQSAPTLKEVLELLTGTHPRSEELSEHRRTVRLQVDCKTDETVDDVLQLVEEIGFPWSRLILAGNNSYAHSMEQREDIAAAVKLGMDFWMNPDCISSYAEMKKDTPAFIARIQALGLSKFTVNSAYAYIDDPLLEQLSHAGIAVSVWTLNDKRTIESHITGGFYNVTSRLPDILLIRDGLLRGTMYNTYDGAWPEVGATGNSTSDAS